MREILFRGKDLQEKNGWIYGHFYKSDYNKRERESGKATLIFTPNCDTFIYCPEYHNSWMVKPETVGQYTGLRDKNGTRIFEGDCFKTYCSGLPVYRHIVRYYPEHFAFMARCIERNTVHYLSDYSPSVIEVIGNIHDNPELLEKENKK